MIGANESTREQVEAMRRELDEARREVERLRAESQRATALATVDTSLLFTAGPLRTAALAAVHACHGHTETAQVCANAAKLELADDNDRRRRAAEKEVARVSQEVERLRAEMEGEKRLSSGDGTDRLLAVLYGPPTPEKPTIGKALGGPNAPMLWAAAEEIERLRAIVRREAQSCSLCHGTGRETLRQYDAASDEMEPCGTTDCHRCRHLREALKETTP